MATEAQRAMMLSAMGIVVYRLRAASPAAEPLRLSLDRQSRVCIEGGDDESVQRLHALLPSALGIACERVLRAGGVDDTAIAVDQFALRGDASAKRALWQSLKPLARRLHGLA